MNCIALLAMKHRTTRPVVKRLPLSRLVTLSFRLRVQQFLMPRGGKPRRLVLAEAASGSTKRGVGKSENLLAPAMMTVVLLASVGTKTCVLHAGESVPGAPGAKTSAPQPKSK
ncbi:MAG: hypothetical protein ABI651_20630 [Verrucomicrobiota bacterium]